MRAEVTAIVQRAAFANKVAFILNNTNTIYIHTYTIQTYCELSWRKIGVVWRA